MNTYSTSTTANQPSVNTVDAQVKYLQETMRQNIQKALNRGDKLEDLESRTDQLDANATRFKTTSKKTKSKFIWKNRKWTLILIAVIATILILVILAIVLAVVFTTKK